VAHTQKQAEDVARQRERLAGPAGGDPARAELDRTRVELDRTLVALNVQLSTAARLREVSSAAADRLRLLNAQLGEAVAQAVELSLTEPSDLAVSRLSGNVDNAVRELEALRQGMNEADDAAHGLAPPTSEK
jgi:hypothetical protein